MMPKSKPEKRAGRVWKAWGVMDDGELALVPFGLVDMDSFMCAPHPHNARVLNKILKGKIIQLEIREIRPLAPRARGKKGR